MGFNSAFKGLKRLLECYIETGTDREERALKSVMVVMWVVVLITTMIIFTGTC
jgi:hypothetical protein